MTRNYVEKFRHVIGIYLLSRQQPNVHIETGRGFIIVTTGKMYIPVYFIIFFLANDEQQFRVCLQTAYAIDHEASCFLQTLCLTKVIFFVKPGLYFKEYRDVLSIFSGSQQCSCDA